MSFGYHRAEVIGAMASIVLIWGLTVVLAYEATMRVIQKTIVDNPLIMLATAGFGLFCNLVMAKILHSGPGTENNPFEHDEAPKPKPVQKKTKMSMQEQKKKNHDIKEDPNESKSD
jgi:Co/Zn/Cd efflux system component